jgi:hypothetical protein
MAVRRKSFDHWPGFNERLGLGTAVPGSADYYALFEIMKRGHRVVFTPAAIVHHPLPSTLAEARARSFRGLQASIAYMSFLFVEEPPYRRELLSYFLTRSGKRFTQIEGKQGKRSIAWWQEVGAVLTGPFKYLFSRSSEGSSEKK